MKKINLFVLCISIIFIISLKGYGEQTLSPRDSLIYLITFADDDESWKKARQEALANPDLLKEIILLPKAKTNGLPMSFARYNALAYFVEYSYQNSTHQKLFFQTVLKFLKNITQYTSRKSLNRLKQRCFEILIHYGYHPISRQTLISFSENLRAIMIAFRIMHDQALYSDELFMKISPSLKILTAPTKDVDIVLTELNKVLEILDNPKATDSSADGLFIGKGMITNLITRLKNKDY